MSDLHHIRHRRAQDEARLWKSHGINRSELNVFTALPAVWLLVPPAGNEHTPSLLGHPSGEEMAVDERGIDFTANIFSLPAMHTSCSSARSAKRA